MMLERGEISFYLCFSFSKCAAKMIDFFVLFILCVPDWYIKLLLLTKEKHLKRRQGIQEEGLACV